MRASSSGGHTLRMNFSVSIYPFGAHPPLARRRKQRKPAGTFAVARCARRSCAAAGVEQRKPLHALGRAADDFERDAATHRMAGDRERRFDADHDEVARMVAVCAFELVEGSLALSESQIDLGDRKSVV